jgi:acyl-CoA hydrolase
MSGKMTIEEAPSVLASQARGGRVFIPSGPIEPLALARAFAAQPHHAADLTFCGMAIPSINTTDWAALHPHTKSDIFLPNPALRATILTGQTRVLPMHYSAAYRFLREAPFKAAVFHVCPPDDSGTCNMSLSADTSLAFVDRSLFKLGIINHALPPIKGAPHASMTLFDATIEIDEAPITLELADTLQTDSAAAIASHVAALVEDGAVLQTGIGKLPGAVMASLKGHRGLRLHSGLIGDWAMDLMNAGAFDTSTGALTAGVILGSQALHEALSADASLTLAPISVTHSAAHIASLDGFTSINAGLEIDLYGQINCEYAGDRVIGGVGGALDFLRGARASRGGKPIVMIASEGKGGVSRIVPRLTTPTVSIGRCDAPILVTEHGWVDLEPMDMHGRAQAIIGLAGSSHVQALGAAWQALNT